MGIFQIALIVATFLCSLVTGLVFAFAVVVMPGIKKLSDREFIRAFQVMDGIIQNNQPVFMIAWIGSVFALVIAAAVGMGQLDGAERALMVLSMVMYLLGVQLPTATINIPLNNRLQALDVDTMSDESLHGARRDFEPRWNRWNRIRTVNGSVASVVLMVLLYGL